MLSLHIFLAYSLYYFEILVSLGTYWASSNTNTYNAKSFPPKWINELLTASLTDTAL